MKTIFAIALAIGSFSAQASDYRGIMDQIFNIQAEVRENREQILQNESKARRVEQELRNANQRIAAILSGNDRQEPPRAPAPSRPRVDTQLAQIALNSCRTLGTFGNRVSCFQNYLRNDQYLLRDLYSACSSSNYSDNQSDCFTRGLEAVLAGANTHSAIASAACSKLDTYADRVSCFSNLLKADPDRFSALSVSACSAPSYSDNQSECFAKTAIAVQTGTTPAKLLLSGCSNLDTYADRVACYKAGISTSERFQMGVKVYALGCYNLNYSDDTANCFTRALKQAQ